VFSHVRIYAPESEGPEKLGNILIFASAGGIELRIPAGASFENENCRQHLSALVSSEIVVNTESGALITDSVNPLDQLQLETAAEHFSAMTDLLPREVWLP
jgi:hypothetical protein